VDFAQVERHDQRALELLVGDGAELLVDCLCYTARDARSLLPLAARSRSTVMLSAKAVYIDAEGNHVNSELPPHFDGPVTESQPTMAPGAGDYNSREGYGANKVAAEQVLLDSGHPVSVLRVSKAHGRGSARPREWVFVRRVLERRPALFLANRGAGIDHPTAAVNLAALVETVAGQPGRRIVNCADPDAPSGDFTHWVLYDLPGDALSLAEAADPAAVSVTALDALIRAAKPAHVVHRLEVCSS